MKFNLVFSSALHFFFFAFLLWYQPRVRKFEGYPTVVQVELVQLKPVSYKAPEVKKVEAKKKPVKPKPKELEGVTVEKKKVVKEPEKQQKNETTSKEADKDKKSTVGGKNVRLDAEEFPFSYYLALLQSRIQTNWEPPAQTAGSVKTIVFFKIQRGGRLTDLAIEKKSGNFVFDQAALRAVTLASPLPPLPADFPQPSLGVHFEFEQGN